MNEMLDRAAGALMRAYFSRPMDLRDINVCVDDQHDLVRAVLMEIRKPTDEMCYIGGRAEDKHGIVGSLRAMRAWEAMIDEALK